MPLVELALLIWLSQLWGLGLTVALAIATGVLGAWLTRYQGLQTLDRFRRSLVEGQHPQRAVLEGMLILAAGAVLLTPGLLTDVAGFLLLVPPLRRRIVRRLETRWARQIQVIRPRGGGGPVTLDADFTVKNETR